MVVDRAGAIAGRLTSATRLDQQLFEVTADDAFPPRTSRDAWQRPVKVMEALAVRPGTTVADIGASGGYFTFRMAARVGAKGKVYAQDLDDNELAKIRDRSEKEKLTQIQTIQGSQDDPRLPELSLDAVLVVDAFHEFTHVHAMMAGIFRALSQADGSG